MSSPTQRLQGGENFGSEPFNVLEFWQWAHSDLLSNTLRGVLAEFLVAKAVGSAHGVRKEWDAYDVTTPEGLHIEVKSAAYVQTWHQDKPSKISFDIAPKRRLRAETKMYDSEEKRFADIYVFALLHEQSRDIVDPTDMAQWAFFVLPTSRLDELGPQKTITLGSLKMLSPVETRFCDLAKAIHEHTAREKP